jgi:hypothetical protein
MQSNVELGTGIKPRKTLIELAGRRILCEAGERGGRGRKNSRRADESEKS